MLCSEYTLVKSKRSVVIATPLYCRSWGCDTCQPRRKRALKHDIMAGNPDTFITLTVNPNFGDSPLERRRALSDAWAVVVARIKRRYRLTALAYFVVVEATKSGEPHLHILLRAKWIDQAWLSRQMDAIMSSPIVDVRRIRSKLMAARYIAKYVGKQPGKFGTSKRYWQSRSYLTQEQRDLSIAERAKWTYEIVESSLFEYLSLHVNPFRIYAWDGLKVTMTPKPEPP